MTDRIASSRITSPQKGLAVTTAKVNGLTGTATTGFFHPILIKKAVKGFGLKSNSQERSLHVQIRLFMSSDRLLNLSVMKQFSSLAL